MLLPRHVVDILKAMERICSGRRPPDAAAPPRPAPPPHRRGVCTRRGAAGPARRGGATPRRRARARARGGCPAGPAPGQLAPRHALPAAERRPGSLPRCPGARARRTLCSRCDPAWPRLLGRPRARRYMMGDLGNLLWGHLDEIDAAGLANCIW